MALDLLNFFFIFISIIETFYHLLYLTLDWVGQYPESKVRNQEIQMLRNTLTLKKFVRKKTHQQKSLRWRLR